MYKTHIDLASNVRAAAIDELNAALADSVDLSAQLKQAHWNVKGPNFIALHKLFDEITVNAREWTDTIAERVTALGGTAVGTITESVKRTRLPAYPIDISAGQDHIAALTTALSTYGKHIRAAVESTTELGDAGTADLFTGISRGVDQYLWFVEAHAQAAS
jgi:starvation-inducible DNA-binding protein